MTLKGLAAGMVHPLRVSKVYATGTTTINANGDTLWLGRSVYDGGFFTGKLDEFVIWDRALLSGERTELWNGGDGLAYPYT